MSTYAVIASLERETGRLKYGYDVWDTNGRLVLRTLVIKRVLRRPGCFFRVNTTGRIYQLESKQRSVEVPAGAIEWR